MDEAEKKLLGALEQAGVSEFRTAAQVVMEQFVVVPKPAVTPFDLGIMVDKAGAGDVETETVGKRLLDQLDAACLKIVKCDE